jgi:hypothetical protein
MPRIAAHRQSRLRIASLRHATQRAATPCRTSRRDADLMEKPLMLDRRLFLISGAFFFASPRIAPRLVALRHHSSQRNAVRVNVKLKSATTYLPNRRRSFEEYWATIKESEMPKIVTVKLKSTAPLSQSHKHDLPRMHDGKETHEAYEARTWREKCNVGENDEIVIPAMAFKQALDAVAKRLGDQIPGKGKATYTKHFKGGVICESDVAIGWKKADVPSITISANSDGVRGSGKRVNRTFPQVPHWEGIATFAILDDTITKQVFERHLREAGRFIGVGRFRPENGGLNGRFEPTKFSYQDV